MEVTPNFVWVWEFSTILAANFPSDSYAQVVMLVKVFVYSIFEPGAYGWVAQMLPLWCAAPLKLSRID